jgi:hypothetical protein
MQALALAFFLVMLELTVGSFVSLYLLDVRGDSSRSFVVFQGVLYLVFAGLTLLFMNAFATPEIVRGIGLDERWVQAQGPLALAFTLLLIPWNVLLWADKQPRGGKRKAAEQPPDPRTMRRRRVRFALGALVALVGLATLFVDGMAYRTLADSRLGGALVVLALVAGGLALGGVMTAMLLGHWYLNTPTASGKPLEFVTTLLLAALAAELVFTVLIGPSTAHLNPNLQTVAPGTTIQTTGNGIVVTTPTPRPTAPAQATAQPGAAPSVRQVQQDEQRQAPLGRSVFVWLQFLMGLLSPLVLGGIALYLTRGRSFQSATGMLYLCVTFVFIGEIIGRGLLLFAATGA